MDLREYEHVKFALADILRSVANHSDPHDNKWHDRLRETFARLADDRFNLAFIGRFSRGKSSLMNALIGVDRLPVGIVPLTSVITTVSYGSKDQAVLRFAESMLSQEIPIGALAEFVTQERNPGNVKRIKVAEVQIRAEILRRGFFFVDTPGLGSAIQANTLTTEAFLPEADAFLLVTSFESPLSEEEVRFLRDVSSSARRIFVVLNKQDTVSPQERDEVVLFVQRQLQTVFADEIPRVFPVSARDGLQAKQANNAPLLAESGLSALEEQLRAFLLNEKAVEFLRRTCDRLENILRDAQPAAKEGLSQRLAEVRRHIETRPAGARFQCETRGDRDEPLPPLQQSRPCEICVAINDRLWDFMSRLPQRLIADAGARQQFTKNRGLCSHHAWQFEAMASDYGVCMAYSELLARLAAWFRAEAAAAAQKQGIPEMIPARVHALLPVNGSCVLCEVHARAEAEALAALASRFVQNEQEAFASLSAICLPHFPKLATMANDARLTLRLMEHQAKLFGRLSEDMQRHVLKFDALRRGFESQEEENAGKRAVTLLAGLRNVRPA